MSSRGGVKVRICCNFCGHVFVTDHHDRRFCSVGCGNRFWGQVRHGLPDPRVALTQNAILAVLREQPGDWVEQGVVAERVYGVDDDAARRAVKAALCRLRSTWGSDGLVIRTRWTRPRLERDGSVQYRLEQDIADGLEAAS